MIGNMKKRDAFGECHPIVQIVYWILVIMTTIFLSHPVMLGISFCGAFLYYILLKGVRRIYTGQLIIMLIGFVLVALINPAFNHYGVTTLFMLKTGPVTVEAVVYGIVLAGTLLISLLWFSCFNEVMTTDRFIYLFGRITPAISLVLSMVFRFVPRFTKQLRKIRNGQRCVGRDMQGQSFIGKVRMGIKELSMLVTWGLESGIDTADSMRARGYGVGKRTAYSVFSFTKRDRLVSTIFIICYGFVLWGIRAGDTYALYNPVIQIAGVPVTWRSTGVYLAWVLCCMIPVLLRGTTHLREKR